MKENLQEVEPGLNLGDLTHKALRLASRAGEFAVQDLMKGLLGSEWTQMNRRVYELLHVFEGLGLVEKGGQNKYRYIGTDGVALKFNQAIKCASATKVKYADDDELNAAV